ncbi:hypothetical protein C6W92_17515, partial [Roseovarius sp. A46]|uniref:hypothetical protein n=1 Tax=Roseovarius sp. A46 TaxID=2109331 RepID=UPI001025AFF3
VGGTDTLDATLVPEFMGGLGIMPLDVQPTTSNIENIEIEARDGSSFYGDAMSIGYDSPGGPDSFDITLDAKDMTDIQRIGSHNSDGDLRIENLTTLTSSGTARKTEDITVVM